MQLPSTFESVVEKAYQLNLYKNLVRQLNKDLRYANINLEFEENIAPNELKTSLHKEIHNLIRDRFSEYLNLLYIVDVSEQKIKELDGNDIVKLSEGVTFLILLREWQKVWFKDNF